MSRRSASRALAVVTDSTAYLPRAELGRHKITEVPLTVVIEGRALEDGTPEAARRLERALGRHGSVTTSRPNPEVFATTYDKLAAAGAREIVSLHLSAEISGTRDAALLAAREAPVPVRVVDTRMVAMGLGFAVLAAAGVAEAGGTAEEAEAAAVERTTSTRALFCVDTLEHLRRGGRIGAARALLGSALAVKPILELADGRIEMLDRVRTTNRAVARLEELVVEHAGDRPVDIAIHHLAAAERAEQLGARLRERLNAPAPPHISEVGAVLGAHTGPGLLGAVVAPR